MQRAHAEVKAVEDCIAREQNTDQEEPDGVEIKVHKMAVR
jgi:hypothetical protein